MPEKGELYWPGRQSVVLQRSIDPEQARTPVHLGGNRYLAVALPVPEGQLPLLERPQLIALNKVDVPEGRELAELVRPELEARGYRRV